MVPHNKRPAQPNLDVRYTKQLQKDAKAQAALRKVGDAGHFVGAIVVGNAGVAVVKLVQQVFNLNSRTPWIQSRHDQRKYERERYRGMDRHYKDHKAHADRVAARDDRDIAWANRTLQQQRFDALLKVFEHMGAALAARPAECGYSSDDLNRCVVKGLQEMVDRGVISPDDCDQVTVDGRPGLYRADGANARFAESRLSPLTLKPEAAAQCRAAIAWEYLAAGLVSAEVLEQVDYPKNEQGDFLLDDADRASIESSSGSPSGSQ